MTNENVEYIVVSYIKYLSLLTLEYVGGVISENHQSTVVKLAIDTYHFFSFLFVALGMWINFFLVSVYT